MSWGTTVVGQIIGHYLLGSDIAHVSGCYLELATTQRNLDGTGGVVVFPDGTTDRTEVRSHLGSVVARSIASDELITVTGSSVIAPGIVGFCSLWTAATGGNMIVRGILNPALNIVIGTPVTIPIGQLSFSQP